MTEKTIRIPKAEALQLARSALQRAGANQQTADSVAVACIDAQMEGRTAIGMGHIEVYCSALRDGRADPDPDISLEWITPVLAKADAGAGIPHPVFELAFDDLVAAAKKFGIAMFGMRGGYTCGALGYFARRLAECDLVSLALANCGPAVVAGSGGTRPVFCTNPLAFSVPQEDGPPLLVDQATSQGALVNIRAARDAGRPIPAGWALDTEGNPTTDPAEALRGMLLTFGGARGANIALIVEIMAAGLNGAQWSLDSPSFADGPNALHVGLTVIAFDPYLTFGAGFHTHMRDYFERLAQHDVYLPGLKSEELRAESESLGILLDSDLLARLREKAS